MDDGEKKMLAEFDKEEEEKVTEGDKSEPPGSSSSKQKGDEDMKPATKTKKITQKRVQQPAATGEKVFDEKMTQKFQAKFPSLTISGKCGEYYKCPEALNMIKETQDTNYPTLSDFEQFVKKLSKVHCEVTKTKDVYKSNATPSYI